MGRPPKQTTSNKIDDIIIFIIGFSCMCYIITTSLLRIILLQISIHNLMPAQENIILWMLVYAVGVIMCSWLL